MKQEKKKDRMKQDALTYTEAWNLRSHHHHMQRGTHKGAEE